MRSLKPARAHAPAEGGRRRADPAPSRLSYRLDRLWLTPLFRKGVRVGLPVFAIVAGLGVYFGDAGNRARIAEQYLTLKTQLQNRPEFMVALMEIDGASPAVDGAIRQMLPIGFPISSFKLDLDGMRQKIEKIDAVAGAEMRVRSGGVLEVKVRERAPVVIWRNATGMELLDMTGHRVATLRTRDARTDLPLIAGQGADAHVAEAMAILGAVQPIMARVRGLVYMGARRWDVALDRDQRILLPETDPAVAAQRVIALNEAQDMLGRDIVAVDMRNANRPTLRLSAAALAGLRNNEAIETRVSGQ